MSSALVSAVRALRVGRLLIPATLLALWCCAKTDGARADPSAPSSQPAQGAPLAPPVPTGQAAAVFAGGCFWCMETAFEGLPGVLSATSGYIGGKLAHPTYEQVSAGGTGHFEAVRVVYDPARIGYARLLEVFVRNIDPTQGDGQFCDHGSQYRSAVFVHDAAQRAAAGAALERAASTLKKPVVTQILDEGAFYVAEEYHQDFFKTHTAQYQAYRLGCGRDARLKALWGAGAGH